MATWGLHPDSCHRPSTPTHVVIRSILHASTPSLHKREQHGDTATQKRELVSILGASDAVWLIYFKPIPGPCGASSVWVLTTDFGQPTEITVQEDPQLKIKLELFVGNEELELETKDSETWAPAQRPYVPFPY